MHLYYFVDVGSVGSVLFDVTLMPVYFDLFRLLTLAFVRLPHRLVIFFLIFVVSNSTKWDLDHSWDLSI